jgi:hypothetical protein
MQPNAILRRMGCTHAKVVGGLKPGYGHGTDSDALSGFVGTPATQSCVQRF